jgi:predicted ribosome quality control (RQC) complex YloA/Tae2 family protein
MITYNIGPYILEIGKDKKENDLLVRKSNIEYTWFHLKNLPSCHGVVNCSVKQLSKNYRYLCAVKIKMHTKFKNYNHLPVTYTSISNVKPTNIVGKVTLRGKLFTINV